MFALVSIIRQQKAVDADAGPYGFYRSYGAYARQTDRIDLAGKIRQRHGVLDPRLVLQARSVCSGFL
ncbi:hypothetical protein D3C73_1555090 [compost metagenome]